MCFVLFFVFLRQGFSVALEPVLELALVDQAGLELRDPPASASRVLGLKASATIAQILRFFLNPCLVSLPVFKVPAQPSLTSPGYLLYASTAFQHMPFSLRRTCGLYLPPSLEWER